MNLDLFKDMTINGQAVVQLSLDGSVVWKKGGEEDETTQYFNIEALEDGTIKMTHYGTNETTTKPVFEYSTDKANWNSWDYSPISVNTGNKVYFRGTNTLISSSALNYSTFSPTCSFKANGNIMSLLYGDGFKDKVSLSGKNYCFCRLFYSSKIVKAPVLPATTLAPSCYNDMFSYCKSLETAPDLPALVVAAKDSYGSNLAYHQMFKSCEKLNKVRCKAMYYYKSTKISSTISTNWLDSVSSTGTFYKNPDWTGPTARGANTIPTGWTIVDWI